MLPSLRTRSLQILSSFHFAFTWWLTYYLNSFKYIYKKSHSLNPIIYIHFLNHCGSTIVLGLCSIPLPFSTSSTTTTLGAVFLDFISGIKGLCTLIVFA